MEIIFTEMRTRLDFAWDTGAPIADMLMVEATYNNLVQSGCFHTAAQEWRKKPAAEKTWTNLQTFFNEEDKDRDISMAQDVGYQGVNAVTKVDATNAEMVVLKNELAALQLLVLQHAEATTRQQTDAVVEAPRNVGRLGAGQFMYSWSHRISNNSMHTSATCNNRAVGHQETAMIDNKM